MASSKLAFDADVTGGGVMHVHDGMPVRRFRVALMDDSLPDPRVHLIDVDSPCNCDLERFVCSIPDLPFVPAFVVVQESTKIPVAE